MNEEPKDSKQVKELRDIKKLLVLLLESNSVDQVKIAGALGITHQAVSKMIKPKDEKHAKAKT
jgi:predicted transcriptional regulator